MFYKNSFVKDLNIKVIGRDEEVINAKIDTGATEILIPFNYRDRLTTISEDKIKAFPKKEFMSASGCTIIGYKTFIVLKVEGLNNEYFRKHTNVYFYKTPIIGKGILFGLIPLKKYFKFCIEKDEFSLQILDN